MGHVTIYDPKSQSIIVHGGSKLSVWFKDVHIHPVDSDHLHQNSWSRVEYSGESPMVAYHSGSYIGGEIIVFGGVKGRECSNQIYVYNIATNNWYKPR